MKKTPLILETISNVAQAAKAVIDHVDRERQPERSVLRLAQIHRELTELIATIRESHGDPLGTTSLLAMLTDISKLATGDRDVDTDHISDEADGSD